MDMVQNIHGNGKYLFITLCHLHQVFRVNNNVNAAAGLNDAT